jgi:hypothetical protein
MHMAQDDEVDIFGRVERSLAVAETGGAVGISDDGLSLGDVF